MSNRQITIFAALFVAVMLLRDVGWRLPEPPSGSTHMDDSTVTYCGHAVKLSRSYDNYEDYKDDPNNIDPSQNELVKKLVSEAPVPRSYADRQSRSHDLFFNLRFPGYGAATYADQPDGLFMESIEIPRANLERFLVFRKTDGHYDLIDDFIHAEDRQICTVREKNGQLSYYTKAGILLFSRNSIAR